MGGPNVCRSRSRTFCCPGWHQRGTTGLCLVPVCSDERCGSNGRCIKPNLCLCDGGKIASHCGQSIENEGKFIIQWNIWILAPKICFFQAVVLNVWMEVPVEIAHAYVVKVMLENTVKNQFAKNSVKMGADVLDQIGNVQLLIYLMAISYTRWRFLTFFVFISAVCLHFNL